MMRTLITIDTELSPGQHQRSVDVLSNFRSSVLGECKTGAYGIAWLMERLEDHGLRGVFFVDPMPGLVFGTSIVGDMIGPIVERGHEVQLHVHTEWLKWAQCSPVGNRTGQHLANFSFEDQVTILSTAIELLVNGGADRPTAFRAGNYGANDDSLRALTQLSLRWDTSVNATCLGTTCRISLPVDQIAPVQLFGVIEMPVAGLCAGPNGVRPAQVCALSEREMRCAMLHGVADSHPSFVVVSHSFEMLSRDRQRPNRLVMRRFERMCKTVANADGLNNAVFSQLDTESMLLAERPYSRLKELPLRTFGRMVEQSWATWYYERHPWPR